MSREEGRLQAVQGKEPGVVPCSLEDSRPVEDKPAGGMAVGGTAAGDKPAGGTAAGDKPAGDKPAEDRAAGEVAAGEVAAGGRLPVGKPAGEVALGGSLVFPAGHETTSKVDCISGALNSHFAYQKQHFLTTSTAGR